MAVAEAMPHDATTGASDNDGEKRRRQHPDRRQTPVVSNWFPPDCAHPEAHRRPASRPTRSRVHLHGTRPFSEDLQRRCVVRSTPIMTRRNTMPTTTVTIPSGSDIRFHHPGSVTGPEPVKQKPEAPRMVRLTVNLPSHLVEHMRDAVYWTPGLTLAWLIARSVRAALTELETIHQGPFPKRARPLRPGRPRLLGQSMKVQPHVGIASGGTSPQEAHQHQAVSLRPKP